MRTLREALERMPIALVREMASFWGVSGTKRAGRLALIRGILAQMSNPDAVHRALAQLDREERDALRTVLAAGGRIQSPAMTRAHGALRPPQLAPADPADLNPTERLHRKGLLFRTFATWQDWQGQAFYVPTELWPHLPSVPPSAPEELLQPLEGQEITATPANLSLHRDLAVLLALLRREDHVWQEDQPPADDLQDRLGSLLRPDSAAYVKFVLHLARQARLLSTDLSGKLRPTAEGRQWLRGAPGLRAQVLFQAWQDDPRWDDLAAIPELLVDRPWPADPAAPRRRILHVLVEGPTETWLAVTSWARYIESTDPDFLRPGGAAGRPRVRRRETKTPLEGATSWREVEGRYLHFLLRGPLHWLGLADIGLAAQQEPAFRLSALGKTLLHPEAGALELTEESIIVEGTFEIWVPAEACPYITFVLESFAERVQWDHLSQYRLTRQALHRALEAEERVERLLEALKRYGRGEIPQNVAYTLQEWAAAYGQLALERPVLLKAEEAVLLEEVLADPQVQQACGERLSPTAILVHPEQAAALVEHLADMGHLPRVEAGVLPPEEHLPLVLTSGRGTALLALLWTWEEVIGGSGEAAEILRNLAAELAQVLAPAGRARAERQKERWVRAWRERTDQESPPDAGD